MVNDAVKRVGRGQLVAQIGDDGVELPIGGPFGGHYPGQDLSVAIGLLIAKVACQGQPYVFSRGIEQLPPKPQVVE